MATSRPRRIYVWVEIRGLFGWGHRAADVPGGTYTLVLSVPDAAILDVGALGTQSFPAGGYAYTGSALGSGGFSRVDRHSRIAADDHDVRHWHVDYLLGHPPVTIEAVVRTVGADVECAVADRLPAGPVDGFGASDCRCRSHLAFDDDAATIHERVRDAHDAVSGT
jgi:endonuclease-3